MWLADNPVKNDQICPSAIPNQMWKSIDIYSCCPYMKIPDGQTETDLQQTYIWSGRWPKLDHNTPPLLCGGIKKKKDQEKLH